MIGDLGGGPSFSEEFGDTLDVHNRLDHIHSESPWTKYGGAALREAPLNSQPRIQRAVEAFELIASVTANVDSNLTAHATSSPARATNRKLLLRLNDPQSPCCRTQMTSMLTPRPSAWTVRLRLLPRLLPRLLLQHRRRLHPCSKNKHHTP